MLKRKRFDGCKPLGFRWKVYIICMSLRKLKENTNIPQQWRLNSLIFREYNVMHLLCLEKLSSLFNFWQTTTSKKQKERLDDADWVRIWKKSSKTFQKAISKEEGENNPELIPNRERKKRKNAFCYQKSWLSFILAPILQKLQEHQTIDCWLSHRRSNFYQKPSQNLLHISKQASFVRFETLKSEIPLSFQSTRVEMP